jgi:glycosyltransferase involved in cell wall biosynthesis
MMPAKIFHLITGLNTGGAEISLYRLLAGMDRSRFENRVVSLIPIGPVGEQIRLLDIPVRSLDLKPGRATPAALYKLSGWLRQERPDVLQTWMYHADLLGILAAGISGTRNVVWNIRNSGMDVSQSGSLLRLVIRACAWLSGSPRAVISNSQAGRDFHARLGYHPRRWVIIPNGIDLSAFKPDPQARLALRRELGLAADTLLIGQIARYHPMKNQAGFLEAAGTLSRHGVQAHFILAGQDVNAENVALAEAIRKEALEGLVHLLGRRDDAARVEASLDILASASSSGEGFPNVVAEAMACGVPCVVTDVGDSAHLVGETGIVVPRRDPGALAAAWEKLAAAGPEKRREIGAAGRRRIGEHFSLDETVSAYQDLYAGLACGPSRS